MISDKNRSTNPINKPFLNFSKIPKTTDKPSPPRSPFYLKKISSFLFISDAQTAMNKELLKRNKISTIINMVGSKCVNHHKEDFSYINFEIKDKVEEKITGKLHEIVEIVEECKNEGEVVLVHCYKGISRAPTAVLAYLIKYCNMDFESAFSYLKRKVPKIDPNLGFLMKLSRFKDD